jgi:hypothetical protein
MTEPHPQEYIITEEQVKIMSEPGRGLRWLAVRIHSRPVADQCPHWVKVEHSDGDEWCCNRPAQPFEKCVYDNAPWKIYRQDAGMGEYDYVVFLSDVFFCRTEFEATAKEIIRAMVKAP